MECCGHDRSTNYCPDCGKELRKPGPLDELLKHCQREAKIADRRSITAEKRSQNWKKFGYRDKAAEAEKCAESWKGSRIKWDLWAAALQEAIARKQEG